jgi:hypothetical protein
MATFRQYQLRKLSGSFGRDVEVLNPAFLTVRRAGPLKAGQQLITRQAYPPRARPATENRPSWRAAAGVGLAVRTRLPLSALVSGEGDKPAPSAKPLAEIERLIKRLGSGDFDQPEEFRKEPAAISACR